MNLTKDNYEIVLFADEISGDVDQLDISNENKDRVIDLIFKYLDRSISIRNELAQEV